MVYYGPMGNVHIIIGEDDFLVSAAAKKVVGDGTGLEIVDSTASGNEELQLRDLRAVEESVMTPPFFDPSKVTWWKNVGFLPCGGKGGKGGKNRKGGGEDDGGEGEEGGSGMAVKDALLAFAKKLAAAPLPPNQKFVLTAPRLMRTSQFAKALAPVAELIVFEKPKKASLAAREAAARAEERAAELGMAFAPGALERFIARVGSDTRSLWSELDKMRDFLGGGKTITADAVDAISSPGVGVEPVLWQVTDAISARDTARLVAAVRQFEGDDGFAVMMTTVVEKHFRQLVEAKDAQERGKFDFLASEMEPWAARKLADALRRWTLRELRVARMRLLALRERCVSSAGAAGDEVVIELVRACARQRRVA